MEYTVKDLPASERPRERLREAGPAALSDAELLALVLRSGMPGKNVVELAQEILMDLDLSRLSDATLQELQQYDGIGEVKAGQVLAVFELANRTASADQDAETIASLQEAASHLHHLRSEADEVFALITLSSRNEVIGTHELFRGSINSLHIEPRVIVRTALKDNAAAVIMAHNHPSGHPDPSDEDICVTHNVADVLETVDIALLDHIVLGRNGETSMKQDGHL